MDIPTIRLMTLNLAHCRKNLTGQRYRRQRAEANLDQIAAVLGQEKPDLLALQEADLAALWSGNFDHVAYLAQRAGYPHFIHGVHVKRKNFSYGTALLSRYPLDGGNSFTFARSLPTISKGFVTSRAVCPGDEPFEIDVVSLHLDFSRESVRRRQARELVAHLKSAQHPLIVMGDFNCIWRPEGSALQDISRGLGLKPFCPYARGLFTFPLSRRRLDWILVSKEFSFATSWVLKETLSDHRAVRANVTLDATTRQP